MLITTRGKTNSKQHREVEELFRTGKKVTGKELELLETKE